MMSTNVAGEGRGAPRAGARVWAGALAGAAALLSAGCGLLGPPPMTYRSNRAVLEAIEGAAGYKVDPARMELLQAEVRDDSIAFVYRGVEHVGDHAWVVRFSPKSTEQDPGLLQSVLALAAVLQEGREDFRLLDEREVEGALPGRLGGAEARYVRFAFDSPVRDEDGRPLPAHGVLARVTVPGSAGVLQYQLKMDNHGDREAVGWEDLEPLIDAIAP